VLSIGILGGAWGSPPPAVRIVRAFRELFGIRSTFEPKGCRGILPHTGVVRGLVGPLTKRDIFVGVNRGGAPFWEVFRRRPPPESRGGSYRGGVRDSPPMRAFCAEASELRSLGAPLYIFFFLRGGATSPPFAARCSSAHCFPLSCFCGSLKAFLAF
jgi:hypothetical protein